MKRVYGASRRMRAKQAKGDVGRRVAELRRARGLAQAAFAEEAEVSLKYVQRVEAGEANLTIETLVKLANLLDAPVAALFEPPATRKARPGRPRKN